MCHYYYLFEGRKNDGEEREKNIWIEQKMFFFYIGLTSKQHIIRLQCNWGIQWCTFFIYLCKLIMCSNITTIIVINFVRWGTHFLNHWIVCFFFSLLYYNVQFAPCPVCSICSLLTFDIVNRKLVIFFFSLLLSVFHIDGSCLFQSRISHSSYRLLCVVTC